MNDQTQSQMPQSQKTPRVRLRIHGRVQGVFYRRSTQDEARRLGVKGWVRNRDDGTVEAVAEGPKEAVEALIAWCHRGPPAARVERVDVSAEPSDTPLGTFAVLKGGD